MRSRQLLSDLMRDLAPGTDWPGEGYYSEWTCACGYAKWYMCGGIIGHPGVPCPSCGGVLEETKSTRRMPMQLVELRESVFRKQIEALAQALDEDTSVLEQCRELFLDLRQDWSDNRGACREGIALINSVLNQISEKP